METLGYIDLYCERTGPELWNEPVNALSNLSFIVAALVAWVVVQRRDVPETVLIGLSACIGVGSFLFHVFAAPWAELADVIPIWTFVACMVLLTVYRMTRESLFRTARVALIGGVIAIGISVVSGQDVTSADDNAVGALNGTLQYLPAVIALYVFAILTQMRRHPARRLVGLAAVTFTAALVFRTIDLDVCAATGIGTHFLWHSLNGVMVGLLMLALIRHLPPARRVSTAPQ